MEAKFSSGAIALLNDILEKAAEIGASDVHIEPNPANIRIRYRVDGLLQNGMTLHRSMQAQLVSRIKIIAGIDISETRVPQDGRTFFRSGASELDLRVSTIPALHGEKVVIRILDRGKKAPPLEDLGLMREDLESFQKVLLRPQGLILVCGPTGCGKTTTLYSSLSAINSDARNIITIEDPIEYQLSGINQIQINTRSGLTFAKGLRGILRQDPDIIMVGEIRDGETASIAVQAAMTGHLVFSTLHTNDAAGAAPRLMDMGVERYFIDDTLKCVISQRLVRTFCRQCAGKGCRACGTTGYRGRTGIFEMLRPGERTGSFKSMIDNAKELITANITSREEVVRSVYLE